MTEQVFLIDLTVESGEVYSLHFEAETLEQAETMATAVTKGCKAKVFKQQGADFPAEHVDNVSV